MFCKKCGAEIPDDSGFCFKCGEKVEIANSSIHNADFKPESVPNVNTTQNTDPSALPYGCTIINGKTVCLLNIVEQFHGNKIGATKSLRALTNIGLVEAKEIIDEAFVKYDSQSTGPVYITKRGKEKAEAKTRIAENKANGVACCPKCGSTSLSGNKKGFGVGKAVVGAMIVAPAGLLAGSIGSQKVKVTCLNCGNQFIPGK